MRIDPETKWLNEAFRAADAAGFTPEDPAGLYLDIKAVADEYQMALLDAEIAGTVKESKAGRSISSQRRSERN